MIQYEPLFPFLPLSPFLPPSFPPFLSPSFLPSPLPLSFLPPSLFPSLPPSLSPSLPPSLFPSLPSSLFPSLPPSIYLERLSQDCGLPQGVLSFPCNYPHTCTCTLRKRRYGCGEERTQTPPALMPTGAKTVPPSAPWNDPSYQHRHASQAIVFPVQLHSCDPFPLSLPLSPSPSPSPS